MTSSEMEKSSKEKEPKQPSSYSSSSAAAPPSSKEPSKAVSTGMTTPDWSGFQAYSPMPPHEFLASSPQPHPCMWRVQNMMMPPYGTPPPHPYVKMYPPGGMYPHPSMPPGSYPNSPYAMPSPNGVTEASGNTSGGTEGDSKRSDVKEKLPIRRSERILNMMKGKNNGTGKNSEASSANGAYSNSGESASDGSSEGSDTNSENDSGSEQDWKDDSPESASESGDSDNGPGNGSAGTSPLPPISQNVPVMPKTAAGVPGQPTNLNIGMGHRGAPIPGMHGKVSTPTVPGVIPPVSRDGGHSQPFQDERELKRQRRKETNREASERSRLRKQAEFDKLAQDTELLNAENASLRAEMNRLKSQREELISENTSLKDLILSFPPLEGIKLEKDDQEPDTYQTAGFTETKFVSYKDSTSERKTNS